MTFIELFRKHVVAFKNDPVAARVELEATCAFADLAGAAKGGPAAFVDYSARRAAAAFALALEGMAAFEAPAPGTHDELALAMGGFTAASARATDLLNAARDCFAMGTMAEQLAKAAQ